LKTKRCSGAIIRRLSRRRSGLPSRLGRTRQVRYLVQICGRVHLGGGLACARCPVRPTNSPFMRGSRKKVRPSTTVAIRKKAISPALASCVANRKNKGEAMWPTSRIVAQAGASSARISPVGSPHVPQAAAGADSLPAACPGRMRDSAVADPGGLPAMCRDGLRRACRSFAQHATQLPGCRSCAWSQPDQLQVSKGVRSSRTEGRRSPVSARRHRPRS